MEDMCEYLSMGESCWHDSPKAGWQWAIGDKIQTPSVPTLLILTETDKNNFVVSARTIRASRNGPEKMVYN